MEPTLRVLVADDHDDSRLLIQTFLSLLGFVVRSVADGREAVREATAFRPDIVFLDIWMPGMSGVETCRRLRDGACPVPIPIYGVTADWKHIENPDRCFDGVLSKPVDLDRLAAVIRSARETGRALRHALH